MTSPRSSAIFPWWVGPPSLFLLPLWILWHPCIVHLAGFFGLFHPVASSTEGSCPMLLEHWLQSLTSHYLPCPKQGYLLPCHPPPLRKIGGGLVDPLFSLNRTPFLLDYCLLLCILDTQSFSKISKRNWGKLFSFQLLSQPIHNMSNLLPNLIRNSRSECFFRKSYAASSSPSPGSLPHVSMVLPFLFEINIHIPSYHPYTMAKAKYSLKIQPHLLYIKLGNLRKIISLYEK